MHRSEEARAYEVARRVIFLPFSFQYIILLLVSNFFIPQFVSAHLFGTETGGPSDLSASLPSKSLFFPSVLQLFLLDDPVNVTARKRRLVIVLLS